MKVKLPNMKRLLIILTILSLSLALDLPLSVQAQPASRPAAEFVPKSPADYATIVYIDPSATTPGDGSSPASPLTAWSQVSFQTNTAYVQKRGTTATITAAISVNRDNVLLGAYGPESDPRPIIYDGSTSIKYMLQIQNDFVTVRDLEIVSPRATSGLHFAAGYAPTDGVAWNCDIHGVDQTHYLVWGIRIFGDRTKVLHSTIDLTGDDGIFVQDASNVEIGYNRITRVNQKWFADPSEAASPGDGVQFDGVIDGYSIHHNDVDRSDTGNKFCYIANTDVGNTTGLIESNTCLIARDRVPIYVNQYAGSPNNYHVVIRNNYFEYVGADQGGVGIWNHAAYPEIYNNVFKNFARGIVLVSPAVSAKIHHNTFSGISDDTVSGSIEVEAHNNIFDLGASATAFSSSSHLTATHNLFTRAAQVLGSDAIVGDPQFVDPANDDFHLQPGSPAINAGSVVPGIDRDAEDNARIGLPDIGAYEFQPALRLFGQARSHALDLNWTLNVTPPVTSTWRIVYYSQIVPITINHIVSPTRAYSLTGLTNYVWYTVTLNALLDTTPLYTDTIKLFPTDRLVHLPVVLK